MSFKINFYEFKKIDKKNAIYYTNIIIKMRPVTRNK